MTEPVVAPAGGVQEIIKAALRRYFPYIVAVAAGGVGYGGGQEKLIEKCVSGIAAQPAVVAPAPAVAPAPVPAK